MLPESPCVRYAQGMKDKKPPKLVHQPNAQLPQGMTRKDLEDSRLRCPKDSTYMEKVMIAGIEIDRCAGCGAMWFDALELDKILGSGMAKDLAKQLDIGTTGRPSGGRTLGELHCPRDRSMLIDVVDLTQEHVQEKACTVCGGVLLDKGELLDLSEFTIREKLKAILGKVRKQ